MRSKRGTPHLLRALEALLSGDDGPTRLDGCVVVAVKGESGSWIWHAAFDGDRLLGTGFLTGLPPDADVILLFTEAQADEVMRGERPMGRVVSFGDHQLLEAFVARYCTLRTLAEARAAR